MRTGGGLRGRAARRVVLPLVTGAGSAGLTESGERRLVIVSSLQAMRTLHASPAEAQALVRARVSVRSVRLVSERCPDVRGTDRSSEHRWCAPTAQFAVHSGAWPSCPFSFALLARGMHSDSPHEARTPEE